MRKALFLLLVFSGAGALPLLFARQSFASTLEALASALPRRTGDWAARDPDGVYDRETIFDYIDGAGEVYRAYNMRRCLSRRYLGPGDAPAIVLDIFDMGSSDDAFGVFTHDREGTPVDVGQEGLYRPGWLSFWKGRFFVSVYFERETDAAKEAVMRLARAVDSGIREKGGKPAILDILPGKGLRDRSVRYLHHPLLLDYHYFLAEGNILALGEGAVALLASYRRDGNEAKLLLVRYEGEEKAKEAHGRFLSRYLPEGGAGGAVLLENGRWSAASRKGRVLAIVLEAADRPLADALLKEVGTDP